MGWFKSEDEGYLHLINQSSETITSENYTRACGISIYYRYNPAQIQLTQNDRETKTELSKEIPEINDEVINTFLTYR